MKRLLLGVLGFGLVWIAGTACALDDGDWQVWNRYTAEGMIADGVKLKVFEEFRVGNDVEQLYEELADLGLSYQATKWLNLGVNYRHICRRSGSDWNMEKRPHLNAAFSGKVGDFGFQDRSRMEIRVRPGRDTAYRYRNLLTLKLPLALVARLVRPYVAGEIFYDFDNDELNRHRLYIGMQRTLPVHLGMDLHYMRQSSKSGDDWTAIHVVGAGLVAKF